LNSASNIFNGTVVAGAVKLADGSQSAVSAADNTRIVWGGVTSSGTRVAGTGFSVSKSDTGTYTLIFDQPFPKDNSPMLVFSPPFAKSTSWSITWRNLATNSVIVETWSGSFLANADFGFIAIGNR